MVNTADGSSTKDVGFVIKSTPLVDRFKLNLQGLVNADVFEDLASSEGNVVGLGMGLQRRSSFYKSVTDFEMVKKDARKHANWACPNYHDVSFLYIC